MIKLKNMGKIKKIWKSLGAGFITGASDDEPSAIATYSIAGAKYGYSMLWAALFTLPFMIVMQEMSGRIGRVTNKGLAGNLKKHYPNWIVLLIAMLIVGANTINIGADMSAMAQVTSMITGLSNPIHMKIIAVLFTVIILFITILLPYKKIFSIFKWTSLTLLAYIFATFTIKQDWGQLLYHTIVPNFILSKDFFITLIAFFGTTISPYLFFWQATEEVEEKMLEQCKPGQVCYLRPVTQKELRHVKRDTRLGMSFSNLITFFIIALSASTLFKAGAFHIETLQDAAMALKPLAGEYSYLLFSLGILSAGFLGIPVLAGSAAYVISEVFGWKEGLNQPFWKAKQFYTIVIASALVGLLIPLLGFHPVRTLFYTSLLYGIISPILIIMVIHMANNKKIMGEHVNDWKLNWLGYGVFIIMAFFSVAVFFIL